MPAATASTAPRASISATLAPSAAPARRAVSGRPAPDSTASASASSACADSAAPVRGGFSACSQAIGVAVLEVSRAQMRSRWMPSSVQDLVPVVEDHEADAEAGADEGGQHEDAQEAAAIRSQVRP